MMWENTTGEHQPVLSHTDACPRDRPRVFYMVGTNQLLTVEYIGYTFLDAQFFTAVFMQLAALWPDLQQQANAAWILLGIFIVVFGLAIWMFGSRSKQRLSEVQEVAGCGGELGDPADRPGHCPPRGVRVFYLSKRNSFWTLEYVGFAFIVSQLFVAIFMQIAVLWPTSVQSQANACWVLLGIFGVLFLLAWAVQESASVRQLREMHEIEACTAKARKNITGPYDDGQDRVSLIHDMELRRAALHGRDWR